MREKCRPTPTGPICDKEVLKREMCKDGPGPLGPRCKKVEEDVHEIGNDIMEEGIIGVPVFMITGKTKVKTYYPESQLRRGKNATALPRVQYATKRS